MLASDNPLEVIAEQAEEIRDLRRELASARGLLTRTLDVFDPYLDGDKLTLRPEIEAFLEPSDT